MKDPRARVHGGACLAGKLAGRAGNGGMLPIAVQRSLQKRHAGSVFAGIRPRAALAASRAGDHRARQVRGAGVFQFLLTGQRLPRPEGERVADGGARLVAAATPFRTAAHGSASKVWRSSPS